MKTRGEKVLWISILVMVLSFVIGKQLSGDRPVFNEPVQILPAVFLFVCLGSALTYIVGFAWIVDEKGYPGVMKLLAFTGIIGLIVILAIPRKAAKLVEPDGGANAQPASQRRRD